MRFRKTLKFAALPLVMFASPSMLMAQMTTPEMPGMPPEVPAAPHPGEGPPMPETPAPPALPETPAAPALPSDPATPSMPSSAPPSAASAMVQGGIRWAPLSQVSAPAPQAAYPPCTREVQDQCTNTRKGTDLPKAKRRPRD